MTHVLAAMKEVMRLHPIAYALLRQATRDEVLPLAYPVTTTTGEVVDEVPIPKGTNCFISVWAYNRLVISYNGLHRVHALACRAWASGEIHSWQSLTRYSIRLPQIWGPDADEFVPERWIEHEKMGQTYVGVTSNLMTFSAGLQACIGWRFS